MYSPGGGGGGHSQYILVGCAAAHKKGVLGTSRKEAWGGGGLKNWIGKKDNLSNWCCTKRGFGSLFINYRYIFIVPYSIGGVYSEEGSSKEGLN